VARRYWPGETPIGQRIRVGGRNAPWLEVVGVTGDVRASPTTEPAPTVYVPMAQHPWGGAAFMVRTTGNAMELLPMVRRVLREMDPALPLAGAQTLEDVFKDRLAPQRLPMLFIGSFASLALVLAVLGVYSIMAYWVTAREREFGIRTALGASGGNVLALVLRQGMTSAVVGTVVGLFAAAAATRVLAALLVGVTPHDPATFIVVPLILLGVTGAACLIPARRATRADPLDALRAE
jgi:predicted lysophospholipase L1 biosynthesis ABC-type transport system permease subunit